MKSSKSRIQYSILPLDSKFHRWTRKNWAVMIVVYVVGWNNKSNPGWIGRNIKRNRRSSSGKCSTAIEDLESRRWNFCGFRSECNFHISFVHVSLTGCIWIFMTHKYTLNHASASLITTIPLEKQNPFGHLRRHVVSRRKTSRRGRQKLRLESQSGRVQRSPWAVWKRSVLSGQLLLLLWQSPLV